jgi:hypothetical protein
MQRSGSRAAVRWRKSRNDLAARGDGTGAILSAAFRRDPCILQDDRPRHIDTHMTWKRAVYRIHQWLGIGLGLLVATWFLSGIAMMYYPWPKPTESRQLAVLPVLSVLGADSALIGFRAARDAAARVGAPVTPLRQYEWSSDYVGGRLAQFHGRPAYQLWRQQDIEQYPTAVVDARSGRVLTPVSADDAAAEARAMTGSPARVASVDTLNRQDRYLLSAEYRRFFPAYAVHFDDAAHTAVYVSRSGGWRFGVVSDFTRFETWFGAVPHWLYFVWLYERSDWWMAASLVLPGVAMLLGLAGIVLGLAELFPRRKRGDWRMSGFRGASLWHHVAGICFGAVVLVFSFSGLLKVLGPDNTNQPGQLERARGDSIRWDRVRVGERAALHALEAWLGAPVQVVAIDLTALATAPGYDVHLAGGREYWVDAETGAPRGELDRGGVTTAAERVIGKPVRSASIERVDRYDTYYYARHGREMHLPAWRVQLHDADHSVLYLNTVTGQPVGFVDREERRWRWARDALHDLDLPMLNARRPAWDIVLLTLMLGGTLVASTGVWLLTRRLARMVGAAVWPGRGRSV